MADRTSRTCSACGARIEFIEGERGRPIPAQRVRVLYALRKDGEKLERVDTQALLRIGDSLYVSHFETCSTPSQFSRGRSGRDEVTR